MDGWKDGWFHDVQMWSVMVRDDNPGWMDVCMYVCMCDVLMYVCMYVCMYACTYICMYTYHIPEAGRGMVWVR